MLLALVLGALLAMLIAGGVALAADITCSANPCEGTPNSDIIIGTAAQDRIDAMSGNDKVYGLGETDALYGQKGGDEIHGDSPPSGFTGDPGPGAWDALYGGVGADKLFGDDGVDVLYAGNDGQHDELDVVADDVIGDDVNVYVVNRRAYKAGEDVIGLEGVRLPKDATAQTLHQDAEAAGTSQLYFYR
jgi:Ca2+-binding RTX toxin-like protein